MMARKNISSHVDRKYDGIPDRSLMFISLYVSSDLLCIALME